MTPINPSPTSPWATVDSVTEPSALGVQALIREAQQARETLARDYKRRLFGMIWRGDLEGVLATHAKLNTLTQ